jgi:hypothetical protein
MCVVGLPSTTVQSSKLSELMVSAWTPMRSAAAIWFRINARSGDLDALELRAFCEDFKGIPWSEIVEIAAGRVLDCLHRQWRPVDGRIYGFLSSDTRRRWVTNALYRRLAERFLQNYDQYPDGVAFSSFQERVHFMSAAHLEEHLVGLQGSTLVFAGLNEDCLRLLLTDDRVPAHSVVLLTQRAGQFLRATLKPIAESFPEFRSYKPRIESILRQLKDLPEDASVLSTSDYVLPTFRVELSSDISMTDHEHDPDSWAIRLESGSTQYRRDTSEVYVYDPASQHASDAGFRTCQVRSLEQGDKLFVMSAELREMVEQVLRDAGVPIQTDKTFETALRSYHDQVQKRFAQRFPTGTAQEKVRAMRQAILAIDSRLEADIAKEQAMRHWIDLGNSPNTPFEQLRPQAPLRESAFKAFAQVLGFSPLEAAYQWQRVIMAVRNSRRLDGRHVSDIYAYMLLQPESAMANSSIKRQTLATLFEKARSNVVTVESASPLKETKQ